MINLDPDLGVTEGVVSLWLLPVAQLDGPESVDACENLLGPEERQRCQRFRSETAKKEFMLGRAGLRLLLSGLCPEVAPQSWRLERAGNGRPFVAGPDALLGELSFNISHAAGLVVVALCRDAEPGVDVENFSREVDALALAERYFSHEESLALQALPEDERQAYFLRLWTLKEACVKADGVGLSGHLSHRCFSFPVPGQISFELKDLAPDESARWQFQQYRLPGERLLTLALRRPAGRVAFDCRIHEWSLSQAARPMAPAALVASTV